MLLPPCCRNETNATSYRYRLAVYIRDAIIAAAALISYAAGFIHAFRR